MAVQETNHPVWGNNFGRQISAQVSSRYGEDGYKYTEETYRGFFGGQKIRAKAEFIGNVWLDVADDNTVAMRKFRHLCGLLKIVMTASSDGPRFIAFLDGHAASTFVASEIEFRIVPEDLNEHDGKPTAEVWFHGNGQRRGPLEKYGTSRIICTFASKEQMDEYLDLTNRRMPKSVTHQGVTYNAKGSGRYESNDGSMLPAILMTYFLLSSNDQSAFAEQNPEVQPLLGDDWQNNSSPVQAEDSSQLSTDVPTYDCGDSGSSVDFNSSVVTGCVDMGGGSDYSSSSGIE